MPDSRMSSNSSRSNDNVGGGSTTIVVVPRSREIASVGLFGALSILLSLVSSYLLRLAFPPVSYLLFDLGEIPVVICFLALGPRAALSTAVIEWIALNLLPTSAPLIGPLFKFLAVASTVLGLWIGSVILRKTRISYTGKFSVSGIFAIILRAALMTIPNILLLMYGPYPIPLGPELYALLWLTAAYNALHVPFDLVPTYIITRFPQVRQSFKSNGMVWFQSLGKQVEHAQHN